MKLTLSISDEKVAEIRNEAEATGRSTSGLLRYCFELYKRGKHGNM